MSGVHSKGHKPSIAQIEAELKATREQVAKTVSDIEDYVRPANVAARGLGKITGFFTSEEGSARPERVAAAVAGVVGLIGFLSRDRD
jgi:hypothetical protein